MENGKQPYVIPESQTQIFVVHQISNACRYIVWKVKKQFTADMKKVYTAPTKQAAKLVLDDFSQKWESKYDYTILRYSVIKFYLGVGYLDIN